MLYCTATVLLRCIFNVIVRYGTATSSTPDGPYTIAQLPVLMGTGNASYAHGDFALFVDNDAAAYIVYNAYDHRGYNQHSNSVDLLTSDYTSSTKKWSGFFAEYHNGSDTGGDEAQVMLRKGDVYYVIIASGCCFCSGGSSAILYTSSSPLGPFTYRYDLQDPSAFPGPHPPPSPPPPPPAATVNVTGPSGNVFCGGTGGQEYPDSPLYPHRRIVLSCKPQEEETHRFSSSSGSRADAGNVAANGTVSSSGATSTIEAVLAGSYGTFGCEWRGNNCYYSNGMLLLGWNSTTCAAGSPAVAQNSSCDSAGALRLMQSRCVGKPSCEIGAGSPDFEKDPCFGLYKSVFAQAKCSNGGVGSITAIAPAAAPPDPKPSPGGGHRTIPAQQSFVLALPGAGGKTTYMWGGDRWQSAPDHFKSHDYQAWVPLEFDESGSINLIKPLTYPRTWSVDVE